MSSEVCRVTNMWIFLVSKSENFGNKLNVLTTYLKPQKLWTQQKQDNSFLTNYGGGTFKIPSFGRKYFQITDK